MDRNNLIKQLRENDKKTYQEIADVLKISKQRVHQIHKGYRTFLKHKSYRRKKIYQLYNNQCYYCENKEKLQIHHKDKNKKNNNIENLILVCIKHHKKLHRGEKKDTLGKNYKKSICQQCKKEFNYLYRIGKFCSKKCGYNNGRIIYKCLLCKKNKIIPKSIYLRQGRLYCSKKCLYNDKNFIKKISLNMKNISNLRWKKYKQKISN